MELQRRFEEAVALSKSLSIPPSNEEYMLLYSLYRQASEGDAFGEKPSIFEMMSRAKFEAWENLKGMNAEEAKQKGAGSLSDCYYSL